MIAKTWVINSAFHGEDVLGQAILTVGITTAEWVHESGDDARPANAATFLWVVLGAAMRLLSVGLLPHSAVTEDECLAQIVPLLRVVRGAGERPDAAALFGVRLANGTRAWP